jgi:hypothetical protein
MNTNEIKSGMRVAHVDGAIQGSGKVLYECPNNAWRIKWADGTYSTVVADKLKRAE